MNGKELWLASAGQDPFGLGFPIQSMSRAEMAEAPEGTVYIMMRVEDDDPSLAWPALRRRRIKTMCDECHAVCWLDPKSFDGLPAHVERLCIPCVMKRVPEGKAGDE